MSSTTDPESTLISVGLTKTESRVFVELGRLGKATAQHVAKASRISRTTVYSALDTLKRRGLVSEERDGDVTVFVAAPPDGLADFMASERESAIRELERRDRAAEEAIRMLTPLFTSTNYSVPRLQFFEGRKGVERMLYDNELEWQTSVMKEDGIWWGYQDVQFVAQYRTWLDHYWFQVLAPSERVQLLTNDSDIEMSLDSRVPRRTVRLLPRGREFASTTWVLGDYVVVISARNQPHHAFQIRDSVLAANFRTIFQMIWDGETPRA